MICVYCSTLPGTAVNSSSSTSSEPTRRYNPPLGAVCYIRKSIRCTGKYCSTAYFAGMPGRHDDRSRFDDASLDQSFSEDREVNEFSSVVAKEEEINDNIGTIKMLHQAQVGRDASSSSSSVVSAAQASERPILPSKHRRGDGTDKKNSVNSRVRSFSSSNSNDYNDSDDQRARPTTGAGVGDMGKLEEGTRKPRYSKSEVRRYSILWSVKSRKHRA